MTDEQRERKGLRLEGYVSVADAAMWDSGQGYGGEFRPSLAGEEHAVPDGNVRATLILYDRDEEDASNT